MSNGVVCNGNVIKDKTLPSSNESNKIAQKPKNASFDSNNLQKSPSDRSVTSQNYSNILKSVGKKIRKTKAELDRSGWIHGFYILALVIYSVIGGALFVFLDGNDSDKAIANYNHRCVEKREKLWQQLVTVCTNLSFDDCQNEIRIVLLSVDDCLRSIDRTVTVYSTSNYLISLIYAITVYTTIGYGTISMSSRAGRAATIVYTVIGTPLFFAFLNDMGQWFQRLFLIVYVKLRRLIRKTALYKNYSKRKVVSSGIEMLKYSDDGPSKTGLIFTCAVIFLILYFLMVSTLFSLIEPWNYFDSFYFVFQSIALIGFGDVFPEHPSTVLFTIIFIIVGISLLSMCFFILQEWIREKTSRLSKRFRYSVRHWRESVHFPTYSISNIYRSSRMASRRESTFIADQIPGYNCNFTTPNSLSASREHSPQLPKAESLNWDRKMMKMNSMGKAVAAGRFQFVTDVEHNSDESE